MNIFVSSAYLSPGGAMHCGQDCAVSARPEQPGIANIYIVSQGHLPSGESRNGSRNGSENGAETEAGAPNETADPSTDGRRQLDIFDTLQVSPEESVLTRKIKNTEQSYIPGTWYDMCTYEIPILVRSTPS